jgi:hypothetical protein
MKLSDLIKEFGDLEVYVDRTGEGDYAYEPDPSVLGQGDGDDTNRILVLAPGNAYVVLNDVDELDFRDA